MTSIEAKSIDYLSSISHIAYKIHQDVEVVKKSHGEAWESFSLQKQEECLDDFFIDKETQAKYSAENADSTGSDDTPDVFPKYLVGRGEKIVIDFDSDGWTWRDEHSAPFSWMSGSQQDLTICWDEQDHEPKTEVKKKKEVSPSPERAQPTNNLNFKPEKSIWQSPFLAADRGFDSSYISNIQAQAEESETENDKEYEPPACENTAVDSPQHHSSTDTAMLLESNKKEEDDKSNYNPQFDKNLCISINKKKESSVKKPWTQMKFGKKADDSYSLMSEKNSALTSTSPESSPERSANKTTLTFSPPRPLESAAYEEDTKTTALDNEIVQLGHDNLSITEDVSSMELSETKEDENEDSLGVKTGFDFLDNW